jgi:aminoglycoside 6'-N-acetyltransferase
VTETTTTGPVLHGSVCTLRRLRADDAEQIADILSQPEVSRWWPKYQPDRVVAELIEQPETTSFAIEVDDQVVGGILYVEEPSPA